MKQITVSVDDLTYLLTYLLTCETAAATGKTVDELVREWLEDRVQSTPKQNAEPAEGQSGRRRPVRDDIYVQ